MLTGDHPGTATAIGKEIGITPRDFSVSSPEVANSLVKTAAEFDGMTDEEIDQMPELSLVIAHCSSSSGRRHRHGFGRFGRSKGRFGYCCTHG